MRYRATVHHNGLQPGDEVDLTDQQVEDYAGEIEHEFLVPVEDDLGAWSDHAEVVTSTLTVDPIGQPLTDETASTPE